MMSQQDGEPPRPDLVTGVTSLEKAAQGGSGFQTYGLDLGVLGSRNNVDDEIRTHSSSSGGFASGGSGSQRQSSSSSYNTQYSSGSRVGQTSGFGHSTSHNSAASEEYEDVDEYEQDDGDEYENSHSSHSSYSYSSQSDPQLKHYRKTRDVSMDFGDKDICESTHCVNVRCVVGPLDKNTGALIALRTRLVAHTLHQVSFFLIAERFNVNDKFQCGS